MILTTPPFGITGTQKEALEALRDKAITAVAGQPRRPRRTREVLGLNCWRCRRDIEIPAVGPYRCTSCGAPLNIQTEATK